MSLLVLDLVSRVIELLRRQEDLNRRTFTDAVAPLLAGFEDVHRDYLVTFRKYFDQLTQNNADNDAVIEEIIADSLFSSNLRDRIRLMSDIFSDSRLQPLVAAISRYLQVAAAGPLDSSPEHLIEIEDKETITTRYRGNIARFIAASDLRRIEGMQLPRRERNWLAARTIEDIVRRLQALHRDVAEAYMRLTVDLLRSK